MMTISQHLSIISTFSNRKTLISSSSIIIIIPSDKFKRQFFLCVCHNFDCLYVDYYPLLLQYIVDIQATIKQNIWQVETPLHTMCKRQRAKEGEATKNDHHKKILIKFNEAGPVDILYFFFFFSLGLIIFFFS